MLIVGSFYMNSVILFGTISVLPLVIGALLGSYFAIKEKFIGTISAFGAGALIAAITFGMMEESFRLGGFDNAIIGFIAGGVLFVIGDYLIISFGGRSHKRTYKTDRASNGWAIVLGQTLDGIPESIALGLGLLVNPKLGLLVLIGVFLSNLPESISSAYDLKESGKSIREIVLIWSFVAALGILFTVIGYSVFAGVSPHTMATFESLAAGAILTMLATTMMPEAYKDGGPASSLATVMGFLIVFIISKLGV
jgi:ZIP family zinc transporter